MLNTLMTIFLRQGLFMMNLFRPRVNKCHEERFKSISRQFSARASISSHRKLKKCKTINKHRAVLSPFMMSLFRLNLKTSRDTICHTWHLTFSKQKPRYAFNGSTSVVINIYEETLDVKIFSKYQGQVNKLTGL
jgi:hypothetical protein